MLYYSTNNDSSKVDFKEATIKGLAPDKGLYFPESIPVLPVDFFENINSYSKEEIAFKVIQPYVGDAIPTEELQTIVNETINFDFPLVQVTDDIFSLELYHGPTLAFKDVGARFMSRCLGYFVKNAGKKVTVLVATSGDTGGAVANGFYDVEGVEVVILYPSGKVSSIQELQLTTLGKNIRALEVNGSFDDCQDLVKQVFADAELNNQLFLTSANSINVARWLPQQFYYFFAYSQWAHKEAPPVICVPSGNFGNICAGLMAHHSGLPVKHFIAATNANNIVPQFFKTQEYQPKPAVATISNAMDVGNPSNFVRILEIFEQQFESLKSVVSSVSISDDETKAVLKEVYEQQNYLLDTHGAVAYAALQQYLSEHEDEKGIILETAHPVKFYDVVEPIIGEKVPMPASVEHLLDKGKVSVVMDVDYETLRAFLLGAM
ncbi:MAG: threonine synthase [Chitinophagaceae bacterium]